MIIIIILMIQFIKYMWPNAHCFHEFQGESLEEDLEEELRVSEAAGC